MQIIETARTQTNNATVLLYQEIHPNNINSLKNYNSILTFYAYGELLRQVSLLYGVFYNHNLPQNIRYQSADLLEQLLGIEPNSGLIVEIRAKIENNREIIKRVESVAAAAGGKSHRRRKSRKITKKNRKTKSRK
jgi:hypothetical protein